MSESEKSPLPAVITFPRDAIVETVHVSAALRVSDEIVGKMDLPCFYAGKRPRFVWGQVLDTLAERAKGPSTPVTPLARRHG
jgi:hypothetical protein